jgi:hypothetical protein
VRPSMPIETTWTGVLGVQFVVAAALLMIRDQARTGFAIG